MNDFKKIFEKKAFIPFITAGDPDLELTERLIYTMEKAGAELIELGIPFSDPVAEGEIIQEADLRALASGVTTDRIFDMLENVRKRSSVAITLMTYANPVFVYGTENFLKRCVKCGVCSCVMPDLPFDEKDEMAPIFTKYGVKLVSVIAPASKDRIKTIAKNSEGFLYFVLCPGRFDGDKDFCGNLNEMVNAAKEASDSYCVAAVGVSDLTQAAETAKIADGVVCDSQIIKIVAEKGIESEKYVYSYVKSMCEAVKDIQ